MAEMKSAPCCRRNAWQSLIPAILAMAYHSFVGSRGPVRSASSTIGCCANLGSEKLHAHFKSETKRLNLKGLVRANKAGCLDHCEMGPSVVIYPEGVWYWVGTEADVTEIMERHVMKGEIVSRLLMPDHPVPEKLAPLKKD